METGHRVIEMSHVRETGIISLTDQVELRLRMGNAHQDSLLLQVTGKIHGTWQFRAGVPTTHALRLLDQRAVLLRIRILHHVAEHRSRHLRIQIGALKMQSQDRATRLSHQALADLGALAYRRERRRGDGRENRCRPITLMSGHRFPESLLSALLEIMPRGSMNIHGDKTGHDIHAARIDHLGPNNGQVAIRHLHDPVVAQQDRTIFQPTTRGQDMSIYNLCQHRLRLLRLDFVRTFHYLSHRPD